jgi:hypothetical protein
MTETSRKKRELLLRCARHRLSYKDILVALADACLSPVSKPDADLWKNYYAPITDGDPILEKELIRNNRSLAWLVREQNRRNKKSSIS